MPTKIDIASNALLLIGDEPISSFSDPGAGATVAANLYNVAYREVLASHPWSFALKEKQLSRLSQSPDSKTGYKYAFQVPVDMVRLWAIFPRSNYVIVGTLLYSNQTELLARYVYAPAETQLPEHFVAALESKLASKFAISITEDNDMAKMFEEKYMLTAAAARNIDSQGRPQIGIIDSPFTDARNGGFDGGF